MLYGCANSPSTHQIVFGALYSSWKATEKLQRAVMLFSTKCLLYNEGPQAYFLRNRVSAS